VAFVFTGTKEAVSLAELLMNYQIKHHQELDSIRDEIKRKTPSSKPYQSHRRFGNGSGGNRQMNMDDQARGNFRDPGGNRFLRHSERY